MTQTPPLTDEALERWPGFTEQSWSERFAELDRRHDEQVAESTRTLIALHEEYVAKLAEVQAETIERAAKVRDCLRLFPEAYDILTNQEMRDAKGNWRSLIDQQNAALVVIRNLTKNDPCPATSGGEAPGHNWNDVSRSSTRPVPYRMCSKCGFIMPASDTEPSQ